MTERIVTVHNETGLHSRPADLFVRTAKLYECTIAVYKGDKSADAKNILKVILLNVAQGDEVRIETTGTDESAALEDLPTLIESNFQTVNPRVTI